MIQPEYLHPGFTKFHLNSEGEEPWPIRPVFHLFTTPDTGYAHCHPWDFTSYVMCGGYVEEIYVPHEDGTWEMSVHERREDDVFKVKAEHVHRIIRLISDACMTCPKYGPTRRTSMFYQFKDDGITCRPWHTDDWRPYSIEWASQP